MPWFELGNSLVFEVSGRDAPRYLHARLSNDMKGLSLGTTCLAGALNAQGRVEGLFTVVRIEPERFILICDGGEKNEVLAALRRFIVADKVTIKDLTASHRLLHLTKDLLAKFSGYNPIVEIERQRTTQPGSDLILENGESEKLKHELKLQGEPELSGSAQRLERFIAGIPSFPEEINQETLLLESGLRQALSFNKGCYVGQEVIERVDALGKVPRKLWLASLEGAEDFSASAVLNLSGDKVGIVISSAKDLESNLTYVFAYLKNLELEKLKQLKVEHKNLKLIRCV